MSLEELFYKDFIISAPKEKVQEVETGYEESPLIDDEIKFLSFEDFVEPTNESYHQPLNLQLHEEDEDAE
jgi:hypothetical protein